MKNFLIGLGVVFLLIALLFVIVSFIGGEKTREEKNYYYECKVDSDCIRAGCSGQMCVSKERAQDIITTCEWREEYECLKFLECKCIKGVCSFEQSEKYKECLKNIKNLKGIEWR